jgi:hypothetical protein
MMCRRKPRLPLTAARAEGILLGTLVLFTLTSAQCKTKNPTEGRGAIPPSIASIGKEVAVSFPASARLIGVHRARGADDLIAVKVEMPASAWPAFLASTPIDPTLFRPGERGLLGPDEGFWDPHRAKNLRTAETSLPSSRVLNLGYDDSRGEVVVVYVVNHGM